MVRMTFGEQGAEQRILDKAARPAVALPLFVLDNAALVIEHALRHRPEQMPHAVAFHEHRPFERASGHSLEIIGAIEIGRPVVLGRADLREIIVEIARQVLAAVEHQMFEQMGKAGLALGLVL